MFVLFDNLNFLILLAVWFWNMIRTVPQESKNQQVRIAKEVFEEHFGLEVIAVETDSQIWSEAGHFNVTVTLKDGTLLDLEDFQDGSPYTLTYSTTGSETVDSLLTDILLIEASTVIFKWLSIRLTI